MTMTMTIMIMMNGAKRQFRIRKLGLIGIQCCVALRCVPLFARALYQYYRVQSSLCCAISLSVEIIPVIIVCATALVTCTELVLCHILSTGRRRYGCCRFDSGTIETSEDDTR